MPDIIEETKRVIELLKDDYLVKLTQDFFKNKIELLNNIDFDKLKQHREALKKNQNYRKYKKQKDELLKLIKTLGDIKKRIEPIGKEESKCLDCQNQEDCVAMDLANSLGEIRDSVVNMRTEDSAKSLVDKIVDSDLGIKPEAVRQNVETIGKKYKEKMEKLNPATTAKCNRLKTQCRARLANLDAHLRTTVELVNSYLNKLSGIISGIAESSRGGVARRSEEPYLGQINSLKTEQRVLNDHYGYYKNLESKYVYLLGKMCYPDLLSCLNRIILEMQNLGKSFERLNVDRIMDEIKTEKKGSPDGGRKNKTLPEPELCVLNTVNEVIENCINSCDELEQAEGDLSSAIRKIFKKR